LEGVIDWNKFDNILSQTDYRNTNVAGRDCFSPMTMFRIMIIKVYYNLSNREIENELYCNIIYSYFCKLSIDSNIPDYSTICRWEERFREFNIFEQLFAEFNLQLESKGIDIRGGTIVDATFVKSFSNPDKHITYLPKNSSENSESGVSESISNVKPYKTTSIDPEARWTKKGDEKYFGYKQHTSVNLKGIITNVMTTAANFPDCKHLEQNIMKLNLKKNSPVYADRGYFSQYNSDFLAKHHLKDFIMKQKDQKFKSRDLNNIQIAIQNEAIKKIRYVVERTFGYLKLKFRIGRSRYIGLRKTHNYNVLASLVFNFVRSSNLLGV